MKKTPGICSNAETSCGARRVQRVAHRAALLLDGVCWLVITRQGRRWQTQLWVWDARGGAGGEAEGRHTELLEERLLQPETPLSAPTKSTQRTRTCTSDVGSNVPAPDDGGVDDCARATGAPGGGAAAVVFTVGERHRCGDAAAPPGGGSLHE
eukprot:gene25734-14747_t